MTLTKLTITTAVYYWRTNLAVALGVAAAVAVLAGALVVGDSVRDSLRDIALGRLGRTDQVLSSMGFFREGLANDAKSALAAADAAPLIVADAFVTLESSGRRASKVIVYGVDERFWKFHGLTPVDGVVVSPALASEVGAKEGDVLLTRLQKPSEVPIESLFGRKEDVGRTVRLTLAGVLPRDRLGEFAVKPQQTDVRAVFAPIRRLQRDLAVPGQVNTILVSGGERTDAKTSSSIATRRSWCACRDPRRSACRCDREYERDCQRRARSRGAKRRRQARAATHARLHVSGEHHSQGRQTHPVLVDHGNGSRNVACGGPCGCRAAGDSGSARR